MNKTKRHKYCLTDKTICLYNAVKERVLRMNRDILKQIIVDQKEIDQIVDLHYFFIEIYS